MNDHIKNSCPHTKVDCTFAHIGCKVKVSNLIGFYMSMVMSINYWVPFDMQLASAQASEQGSERLMHGSMLPVTIPPPPFGKPPGQVQSFVRRGGELLEAV